MKSLSLASVMLALALSACAGTAPQDVKLSSDVANSLKTHAAINPNSVRIQTADGVVYLNGVACTWLQYHEAEDTARAVPGVIRVVNKMEVGGP